LEIREHKTAKIILVASLVIVMLGFGIAIPLMPFYIIHFNASGSTLGLMMSLYSLMQFIFAPMWGRLSDRIGRKPILLIGIGGYFLAFMFQGISQNIIQFLISRTLAGILSSAALPTAMAYIADITAPEERSKGVGMMGAAMGIGMIFGPLLGGVLAGIQVPVPDTISPYLQVMRDVSTGDLINLSIPFFASAFLALLALPFIGMFLPESLRPEDRIIGRIENTDSRLFSLLSGLRGPSGFLLALAFLLAFALANMESVLALYGGKKFAMGPSEIGFLMGGLGITSVIGQGFVIGPITRRFGERRIIQGGLVTGILGFLGMAALPFKAGLITSALVFSAGNVLLAPSITSLISKQAKSGQGEAMGLNNSFQALGRGIGPLWAGFAFDIYSTLSFWSGALVQLIAFIFTLQFFRKELVSEFQVTDLIPTQTVIEEYPFTKIGD
jgi:DHA1 family multidrug resistance protein-like MFS transporter